MFELISIERVGIIIRYSHVYEQLNTQGEKERKRKGSSNQNFALDDIVNYSNDDEKISNCCPFYPLVIRISIIPI